ncbi:PD-(D/E)XK nuclease family protein [Candidatus Saccharibacteria bacterium]|nr:PD-(D/E)XK nuclease family protein [Candidatus Saccharibacteria bacterium]
MKSIDDLECYVICRMYAGGYISNTNIGHEVINLFSADNGHNYIYVTDDGLVNPKYNKKVKGVILTRISDSIHKLEVLGIAKLDETSQISFKSNKLKRPDRLEEQNRIVDEFLAKESVNYGGVPVEKLFNKNIFRGKEEDYHLITFRAKEFLLPYQSEDKKVYICDKKYTEQSSCNLSEIIFPSEKLKRYIDNEDFPEDFKKITELINDETLWDKSRKCEKLKYVGKELKEDSSFNYLDIIGKQDDENVFSNLISYFLGNDQKLFVQFCKEVLDIPDFSADAKIEREKSANRSRMDLYFTDEKYAVVIENKIKSEINSINERHSFNGDLVQSQLADYYNYVEKTAKDRVRKYFILMPNYHQIDISKYKHSKSYKKIYYDQLLKFFNKHSYANKDEEKYYEDFKKALLRHAENYYDDQYLIMKRRFLRKIQEYHRKKD